MPFLHAARPSTRGTFARVQQERLVTPSEARDLFAQDWPDPRTRTACLLATSTGMRLREARRLLDDALHSAVVLCQSWRRE